MEDEDEYLRDISHSIEMDESELRTLLKMEDLFGIRFQIIPYVDTLEEFLPLPDKSIAIDPYDMMRGIFLDVLMRWDQGLEQMDVADAVLVENGQVKLLSINVPSQDAEHFPISILKNFRSLEFLNFTNLDLQLLDYFPDLIGLGVWRRENPMQRFPGALKRLKYLNLHNQNLSVHDLSLILPYVPNLEMLNACDNNLTSLPVNLSDISKIQSLDFSGNKIDDVNLEGIRTSQLEQFLLQANGLRKVTIDLAEFPKLIFLDLRFNSDALEVNLENLPGHLVKIKR